MMGDRHLRTLALDGFPRSTYPGALSVLDSIPCEYRWNTRAILLDPSEAQGVIAKIGKKWKFQQRGLKDQVFKSSGGGQLNQFAMTMVSDSDGALAEATSGDVHFCYFSSSIVLQHKDRRFLDNMIGEFRKALINRGFGVRVEDINAVDAFFGTLPGNGVAQVRRVIAHTRNYVDLMPISSVWAGESKNPSALMPPNSPPLLYAATQGGVPYRLNLPNRCGQVGESRAICRAVVPLSECTGLRIRQRPLLVRALQGRRRTFLRHRRGWAFLPAAPRHRR
jgi:type IV secretion system protein VirB4